jgi:glycosyltransferase involved in cell wall biosynthesis
VEVRQRDEAVAPPTGIPNGSLDAPAEGDMVDRRLHVEGWAAPAAKVDRVELFVDGRLADAARLCSVPRADVVSALGDPGAVLSGYTGVLDLTDLPVGTVVTVRAEAVAGGGRTLLGERRVILGGGGSDPEEAWTTAISARADMSARPCVSGGGVRVLIVTHDLNLGGAQLWLQQIVDRLLSHDTACTVVAPTDGPLRRNLEAVGVRVHLLGPEPRTAAAYESMVRALILLAADEGCNVALANTIGSSLGVDAAARCGMPAVLAIHEHLTLDQHWAESVPQWRLDPHVRARRERAFEQAKVVCFVAEATRQLYLDASRPDGLVTVDYGVPLQHHRERRYGLDRSILRAAHGYGLDDTILLCVGRVEWRKGQSLAVAALARLAAAHPGAHLVAVGDQDGEYGRGLLRMAEGLGLTGRVRVVPATDDVARWYVMADAFVLCSDLESMPRSIMEAMAYELPVVATAVGGVPDLVRHRETGFLCDRRDLASITEAINAVLCLSPDERRAMGRRGAEAVEARGDATLYTLAFTRLVRGLANDPHADPAVLLRGGTIAPSGPAGVRGGQGVEASARLVKRIPTGRADPKACHRA